MVKEFFLEGLSVVERILKHWAISWVSRNVQVTENDIERYLRMTNGSHHFRSCFFDGMEEVLCGVEVESHGYDIHEIANDAW